MSLFGTVEQMSVPIPDYKYITKEEDARTALSYLDNFPILEVDTEGTALDPYECRTTLVQIGVPGEVFVFDVRSDLPDISVHGSLFKPLFTDKTKLKLLQNCNYDMKVIKVQFGYYIENVYDTMLAEMLMTLGIQMRGFTLAALVNKYLHMIMDKEPRGTFQDYGQVFTKNQLDYAASDVITLDIIRNMQMPRIKQFELERSLDLEMRFTKPLAEMELNGIRLDVDKWKIIMKQAAEEAAELKGLIEEEFEPTQDQTTLFGVSTINIDSPAQLKVSLSRLGIQLDKTDVEALERYKGHPIIDNILTYRKLQKLGSTYGEALINRIHPKTGKLHTQFKQMVSTGRLSSNDPNLQNIPGKQKYRTCFIADEGYDLFTADMSGAELRIMGDLSGEPNFIKAYSEGIDLHTLNASNVFKVGFNDVTKFQRGASKAVTFGLCVKEDSYIITNKGIKYIRDTSVGQSVAHDICNDKIIDHAYKGEKECFKITTQYGYTLETTAGHEIKVIDSSGNYIDKKLEDINIATDYACLKVGSGLFNNYMYKFESFFVEKNTNYQGLDLPEFLTLDVAAFLGLFISEGSIQKKKDRKNYSIFSMALSANVDGGEFVETTKRRLTQFLGERLSVAPISENRTKYSFSSVLFCGWVMSLFDCLATKNKDIHVPACLKESPKEIQAEFLRFLFEGDGTNKSNGNGCTIAYSSKSERLVRDVQIMLLNFGILSSVDYETRKEYPGEKYYVLRLVGKKSYDIYLKDIGFVTKFKESNCTYSKCLQSVSSFSLPNQMDRLINIKKMYSRQDNKNYTIYDTIRNCQVNSKGKIGNLLIDRLQKYDESDFLSFVESNGIVVLPIESIVSVGKQKVYDISVENRQLFLANGFIVHNCYGMSPVGLSKRLKISRDEAESIINAYFIANPALKRWLDSAAKSAISNRYSTSASGRKRFFNIPPASDPTRKAIVGHVGRQGMNAPVQGCVAAKTQVLGHGYIKNLVGQRVELETGFGKDSAVGVYSGKKELYNLTFSNGIVLDITDSHKIPIVTEDGPEEKQVKDLLVGRDYFLIPLSVVKGTPTNLSGFKYIKGHWRETFVDFALPKTMTTNLAFILGCLIGDGSYTKHNHIKFCAAQDAIELYQKYNTCIHSVFGYVPVKTERLKNFSILKISQVSSVVIRGFLKSIGLDYVTGINKSVPQYFFTESLANKGALLNGLFSTDGGMTSESGPNYTTISKELASGIHILLFSLGIPSNLKTYEEKGRLVYRIQVPKRFNKLFYERIGFSVDRKTHLLKNSFEKPKCGDGSVVPSFIPKLIYKEFRESGIYGSLSTNQKAHLRRFKLGKCSFDSWRTFYKIMPEGSSKKLLSTYLNFDFCTLKSISKGQLEDTYDLMCENIHYFVANGVVVHNSNADTIKEAMIICVDKLEKLDYNAKLLLTVHDELICTAEKGHREEVAKIVVDSLVEGFGKYLHTIPMESDALIGDCWLKSKCENKIDGKECGGTEMVFEPDEKYGTKLVCGKCGANL